MDIVNYSHLIEQPLLFVFSVISSIFSAFFAWHKFFQDYWLKRKLRLYSFLVSTKPEKEKEISAIKQLEEEERFLLTFGRPSTPIMRELVWQAYKRGLFSHNQFLLARIYFDVSNDNKLEVKVGTLEKTILFLYMVAFFTMALSLYSLTYYLLIVRNGQDPFKIVVLFMFYVPAMLFFFKELMGLSTARIVGKKIEEYSQ